MYLTQREVSKLIVVQLLSNCHKLPKTLKNEIKTEKRFKRLADTVLPTKAHSHAR